MILSNLMTGFKPITSPEGQMVPKDMVLAVGLSADADVEDYAVVRVGTTGLAAALNPQTIDRTYIAGGLTSFKVGNQRTFKVTGDRYLGDDFQDHVLSHGMKYGVARNVVLPYVYFSFLTGEGEQGEVSVIVNNDSGDAEFLTVDIDLRSTDEPEEYTYTAPPADD